MKNMGLNILSKKLDSSSKVFNNIILAVLDAHLYCGINDSVQKGNGAIKDIDVRRYFGNKEDEYEYFLIDIPETEWSMKVFEDIKLQGVKEITNIPWNGLNK